MTAPCALWPSTASAPDGSNPPMTLAESVGCADACARKPHLTELIPVPPGAGRRWAAAGALWRGFEGQRRDSNIWRPDGAARSPGLDPEPLPGSGCGQAGHDLTALLPFKIGPMSKRKGRESGLRLRRVGCATSGARRPNERQCSSKRSLTMSRVPGKDRFVRSVCRADCRFGAARAALPRKPHGATTTTRNDAAPETSRPARRFRDSIAVSGRSLRTRRRASPESHRHRPACACGRGSPSPAHEPAGSARKRSSAGAELGLDRDRSKIALDNVNDMIHSPGAQFRRVRRDHGCAGRFPFDPFLPVAWLLPKKKGSNRGRFPGGRSAWSGGDEA
jgi:hypothetical protein